jgi:hypothetical protein
VSRGSQVLTEIEGGNLRANGIVQWATPNEQPEDPRRATPRHGNGAHKGQRVFGWDQLADLYDKLHTSRNSQLSEALRRSRKYAPCQVNTAWYDVDRRWINPTVDE